MRSRKLTPLFCCSAFILLNALPAFCTVSCSELRTKIEDGLKAKGVTSYTLTVAPMAEAAEGKVVGTCDGNTQKIVYSRTATTPSPAAPKSAATKEKKPETK